MTAFSKLFYKSECFECDLSLSSVNSRYVDISLRIPDFFAVKKWDMEKLIKQHIRRGKLALYIKIRFSQKYLKETMALNDELIRSYYEQIESMGLPLKISVGDLMKMPHAVENISRDMEEDEWKDFSHAMEQLISRFLVSGDKEGAKLQEDISGRLKRIRVDIDEIEGLSQNTVDDYREMLLKRVEKLKMEEHVDETRLYKEISYFAENQDFTEEIVRLKAHCGGFDDILNDDRIEKGKRLNFLLQEMNREVNTVGSKCRNSEIARYVVEMKDELEKIREQIQNVW